MTNTYLMESNYINTIESLAISQHLRSGDLEKATEEILKESANTLACERVNAWIFTKKGTALESLKSYLLSSNTYKVEGILNEQDLPNYFKFIKKGALIISDEAENEDINKELLDIYITPLKITSMIDVPIRSEGEMIGIICFEHVINPHQWTNAEKRFTQSIAQLLSLALESAKKKNYREKLESTIREKEVLISEVNHRVKNNMSVIISLLKIQKGNCPDEHTQNIFDDIINKVFSMSAVQDQLHASQNFSEIELKPYLNNLISNLNETYGTNNNIKMELDLSPINLDLDKAVPCGLILNEILTNSFKYAFGPENSTPQLTVKTEFSAGKTTISIKDNGPGFQPDQVNKNCMGLELIEDLKEQIDGEVKFNLNNGVDFSLSF